MMSSSVRSNCCDQRRLEVIRNLGTANGIDFIEVLDRGPGIPAQAAERMLQPFTRLEAARSGSGTGLGLAIVNRIAAMHGGAVRLLPREGGGLRARVELPAHPNRGEA